MRTFSTSFLFAVVVLATPAFADSLKPLDYQILLGSLPEYDQAGTEDNGYASATAGTNTHGLFVSVSGSGENQYFNTEATAQASFTFIVDGPSNGIRIPVDITGSYSVNATGVGWANARVADGLSDGFRGGDGGIYNAGCGYGAGGAASCGSGSFTAQGTFLPGIVYSFILDVSGQVLSDTDGIKGGTYSASLDPIIFIDNSSGKFGGYGLDIEPGGVASATSTPLPATWALMLSGLSLFGAALRRHRA